MLPKQDPRDGKVLWYDFRRSIPEVAPVTRFGAAKTPKGQRNPSRPILVAHSSKPASKKQFVWRPDLPEPIPKDVPVPNLLALAPVAPPPALVAPPVRKPAPKPFALPSPAQQPKPRPTPSIDLPPEFAKSVNGAALNDAARNYDRLSRELVQFGSGPNRPLRPFTVPAARGVNSTPGGGSTVGGLGSAPGAPLADAPSAAVVGGPARDVQVAIVGLNPAPQISALPEGSRPAQFAQAPESGPPSSGDSSTAGVPKAPGLMARGNSGPGGESASGAANSAAANSAPAGIKTPERRLLKEIVLPSLNRTMSAPLRPSSRIIPAGVEALFENRNVYTLVVPGPDVANYAGDWVLWFSARHPSDAAGGRISAPVPSRKYSWTGDQDSSADPAGSGAIQLAAVVDRNGSVSAVRIIRGGSTSTAFRMKAIQELQTWEFQPALNNTDPIEVDIVVEIPFQFGAGASPAHF